jgi:DNA helicase IV
LRILPQVVPSSEQLPILADGAPGLRIIRGAAGSGKTTTALLRLRQLCFNRMNRRERLQTTEPVRVLVLTYNRTLEGYISELARSQVTHQAGLVLEISTFSRWARSIVGPVEILDRNEVARLMSRPIQALPNAIQLKDFYVDEVEYALSRFLPAGREAYMGAERTGRGITPRVDRVTRRRLLDEVVRPYEDAKSRRGVLDWNDLAIRAITAESPGYDVVIVDEAQDFSANQVRAVLAHLADNASTTFVLDTTQRIYPRFFTWAEVELQVRPNIVWTLNTNHRNTVEIAAFARPLVEDLPVEDDGALPDFDACTKSGPVPRVIAGRYSNQLECMLDQIVSTVDLTSESVAILQPRGGRWFAFARGELGRRGLPYCELTRVSNWPADPKPWPSRRSTPRKAWSSITF